MVEIAGSRDFGSLEVPLRRLGRAIEQAERELHSLRQAYLEAERRTLDPASRSSQAGPDTALSRQELRVAALIAEGRSNGQIAAMLNVSVHTVKSHVQSILRKRAIRSRWQLLGPLATRDLIRQ